MTSPDLKTCPFCGGEAELSDNLVSCSLCLCSLPFGFGYEGEREGFATEAEAIAAWNTRAPLAEALAVPTEEHLAFVLWKEEADRAAPNVGRNRTPEMFSSELGDTRNRWLGLARAALRAIGG